MLKKWKKLSEEVLFKNPWWVYKKDIVQFGENQKGEYNYVYTPGSVMIIPVRDDGSIIFVNQYRYLNERTSIEFPGGGVKEGIDPMQMAAQELREEAKVEASALKKIGKFNPFNGVTNELCSVFEATGLQPVHSEQDSMEEFEYLYLTPEQVTAYIADNTIWDGMTLAAWQLYQCQEKK